MRFFRGKKRYFKSLPAAALLIVLSVLAAGCEDFSQYPLPTPAAEPPEEVAAPATTVSSGDRAILSVYQHLLTRAESDVAKSYLADFYAVSDNWAVQTERFTDGSSAWYVTVIATEKDAWQWETHWQQAAWLVFRDGEIIAHHDFAGNALRIEADMQRLSAPDES